MTAPKRPLLADLGLLLLRLGAGLGMAGAHGWPKLSRFAELSERFPDPLGVGSTTSLALAVFAEAGCGILLAVGLGTRLATIPLAFTMTIAAFVVHASDPWARKELALAYLVIYVALALTGAGRFSIDARLGGKVAALR